MPIFITYFGVWIVKKVILLKQRISSATLVSPAAVLECEPVAV